MLLTLLNMDGACTIFASAYFGAHPLVSQHVIQCVSGGVFLLFVGPESVWMRASNVRGWRLIAHIISRAITSYYLVINDKPIVQDDALSLLELGQPAGRRLLYWINRNCRWSGPHPWCRASHLCGAEKRERQRSERHGAFMRALPDSRNRKLRVTTWNNNSHGRAVSKGSTCNFQVITQVGDKKIFLFIPKHRGPALRTKEPWCVAFAPLMLPRSKRVSDPSANCIHQFTILFLLARVASIHSSLTEHPITTTKITVQMRYRDMCFEHIFFRFLRKKLLILFT